VTLEGHEGTPHPPADLDPRKLLPPFALLWRAVLLLLGAGFAFLGAKEAVQYSWWLTPIAVVSAGVGVLAGWAGLIEITGGEKFDDHPWV